MLIENKIIKKIRKNKFLVSFSLLASSSVIAQFITTLISPITTRLFTPEQFGIYTLITTVVSIFGPVICLKYDMSIVTSKTEKETYALIKLCILLCIPLSAVISILYGFLFLSNSISQLNLFYCILAMTLLLVAYGINNVLLGHNNRNSLYKLISSVTVVKSLVNNGLLLLTGFLHMGAAGLIGSQIISYFAGAIRQSENIKKNRNKFRFLGKKELFKVAIKNKNQPIYNASSALLSTSIYSSINLFVVRAYSTLQLGLYSLSYRVLGIPFSIISANIARVYFNSASKELQKSGSYNNTFNKTLILLLCTIIPLMFILALVSPWLFSFVFGKRWTSAGEYVRILAPMFGIRLISESLTTGFILSRKQHLELIFQSALFITQLSLYLVAFIVNIKIEDFLFCISIMYVIFHFILLYVMYRLSQSKVPL